MLLVTPGFDYFLVSQIIAFKVHRINNHIVE